MCIFGRLFRKEQENNEMKYLIACLGNIGAEYDETRHNIGFKVADKLVHDLDTKFTTSRLAQIAEAKIKNRNVLVIKPTTYMNLSGKAIQYYVRQEKIAIENILIVCDDIALPLGTLRLKKQGSDGGHNGLANIIELLGTNAFCRLRFGIGNDYAKGHQVDFVLGKWKNDEQPIVDERADIAVGMVKSFVLQGADRTMNEFNNK